MREVFPSYRFGCECEHETLKLQILEKALHFTHGNLKGSKISKQDTHAHGFRQDQNCGKFSDVKVVAGKEDAHDGNPIENQNRNTELTRLPPEPTLAAKCHVSRVTDPVLISVQFSLRPTTLPALSSFVKCPS